MGLRELKAQRTRDAIVDSALRLFEQQGFDATTMEHVAQAAEVGTSTLYRYFPAKDELLRAPLDALDGVVSGLLREQPEDEPVEVALGAALIAGLERLERSEDRVFRLRAIIDGTPVARARLWDLWNRERMLLADEIARRTGLPAEHPRVELAARLVEVIAGSALDAWRDHAERPRPSETARAYLDLLRSSDGILPRPPA